MAKLTDALTTAGFDGDDFQTLWETTEAADERQPLPGGEYVATIERGEFANVGAKRTPSFKLTFRVSEGDMSGRLFWLDLWLTRAALPQSKRDLAKLGIESFEKLHRSLRQGFVCKVRLALRRDDDGTERNRVIRFDVIRVEEPELDPFGLPTRTED